MTADPVNWDLAEKVAVRVAGREPFAESYHYASLKPDFDELTEQAESLVAEATGLRPPTPARARVTDRAGWVHANVKSFQRLLRPVTDKLGQQISYLGPEEWRDRIIQDGQENKPIIEQFEASQK